MMDETKLYFDKDVTLASIEDKVVAVIGYGNQGRAQAKNLRDSGVSVYIGLREDSTSFDNAVQDGFNCLPIDKAVKNLT